jgi:hypothetical protein
MLLLDAHPSTETGGAQLASMVMGDNDLDVLADALGRINEELPRLRGRMRHLASLGFSRSRAAELAVSDIDIGELERLVGMGCPAEVAVAIVQ